jgi:outer membrane protein assembly factor BamA
MKLLLLPVLATAALFAQSAPGQALRPADETAPAIEPAGDLNVNSKYIVESIRFVGRSYQLSRAAIEEMHRLIGAKVNTEALTKLTSHIRTELRAHAVTFKLDRGDQPGSVTVLLQVDKRFDLSIPRFAYNSNEGWAGIGEARATLGSNVFTFDVLSDRDSLVEQFAGIEAKYERPVPGTDRVLMGFEFDQFHEQYDLATRLALASGESSSSLGAGTYRSRTNFQPSATFVLAKPLTLTVGLSFNQLQPELTAARSESANLVVNTLRYHQSWEDSDATMQELDAGYDLRAATKLLSTDLGYTRHAVNARYSRTKGHQNFEIKLALGLIYGHAPLFERFVLGDSYTLRGWNKYELDPLGGNRLAYSSVTYGYHIMRVFFDAGSVWDQGKPSEWKQSAGVGISSGFGRLQRGAFLLAVAFPLRQDHVEPVFIAGMNF